VSGHSQRQGGWRGCARVERARCGGDTRFGFRSGPGGAIDLEKSTIRLERKRVKPDCRRRISYVGELLQEGIESA